MYLMLIFGCFWQFAGYNQTEEEEANSSALSVHSCQYGYLALAGPYYEHKFYVCPNVLKMKNAEFAEVSLVVQGSVDNIQFIPLILTMWHGPMELVVLIGKRGEVLRLAELLKSLITCSSCGYLNLHIVLPVQGNRPHQTIIAGTELLCYFRDVLNSNPLEWNGSSNAHDLGNCFESERNNFEWKTSLIIEGETDVVFPANLLRNVGRNFTSTPFHLLLDADVIPNWGLFEDLQKLLSLHSAEDDFKRVGLAVPVFETDLWRCCLQSGGALPRTKNHLLQEMVEYGSFVPFYWKLNSRVQRQTNYKKWYRLPADSWGNISVAYTVEWTDPYEPFLLLHRSAPLFNSRFVQYGVNRLSHLCELHMAGWELAVLDNAFLLHCGFKTEHRFHKRKTEELINNQILYKNEFFKHLKLKYPESRRTCF